MRLVPEGYYGWGAWTFQLRAGVGSDHMANGFGMVLLATASREHGTQ